MRLRRLIPIAGALATLVAPLTAAAQGMMGSVTTAPVGQPAPALGMPLLFLLAVVLAGVGVYRMRISAPSSIAMVVLAGVIAVAGLGYADGTALVIRDANCMMRKTATFPLNSFSHLMSECSNPIMIVALDYTCASGDVAANTVCPSGIVDMLPTCQVGQVLALNESCELPNCCEE